MGLVEIARRQGELAAAVVVMAIARCTSHIVLTRQVSPRTAPLIEATAQPGMAASR